MVTVIGKNIEVFRPSLELKHWCKKHLEIPNPAYAKRKRMGFSTYGIPPVLVLYEEDGDSLYLPYGCQEEAINLTTGFLYYEGTRHPVDYRGNIPLYDYQETAVQAMMEQGYGILQSPAGSGKTQMGLALVVRHGYKALWVTHTRDLLKQSRDRAKQYLDESLLGTITEGKVQISEGITFATVQTLANLDLPGYEHTWDTIIVDECHRVAGSPTSVTRFYRVLNNLSARHKYGLSATVHRADGLIRATCALLGPVQYQVPEEAVQATVMPVTVRAIPTGVTTAAEMLNGDGTLNYQRCVSYLVNHEERNKILLSRLVGNARDYNLILSERVGHLERLCDKLVSLGLSGAVIDGKTPKKYREQAIEAARSGELHYLFATYALAKEGLDIPRLDRLHLATPQKDYAVVTQAVGRVARRFPGKETAVVYDYVDSTRWHERAWKIRCRHYRKCGCVL